MFDIVIDRPLHDRFYFITLPTLLYRHKLMVTVVIRCMRHYFLLHGTLIRQVSLLVRCIFPRRCHFLRRQHLHALLNTLRRTDVVLSDVLCDGAFHAGHLGLGEGPTLLVCVFGKCGLRGNNLVLLCAYLLLLFVFRILLSHFNGFRICNHHI